MSKGDGERITVCFNIVVFILILVSGNTYLYGQEWVSMFSERQVDSDFALENKLKSKINLNYKNAEIKQVLRSLSQTYKLNIMINPEVEGRVNINLKEAPLEKALEVILGVNKLTYHVKEGVIYISGSKEEKDLITETIFLKYVGQEDVSRRLENILSEKGSFKTDSSANSVTVTDYLVNVLAAKNEIEKIDISTKQIFITPKLSRPAERAGISSSRSVNPDFYKEFLTGGDKDAQIPLVYSLFDKARKLDEGVGREGDDSQSLFRKTQALDIYERIMSEFSDSERMPEVKFNAAMIYYRYLKNYDKAKSIFSDLIFYYPDSPFAKKAKQIYERLGLSSMELKPARPLDLEIFNDNQ